MDRELFAAVRDVAWIVTSIADQAVILPFVAVVGGVLAIVGERRAALWWVGAVGAALLAVLVAKLLLIPCGPALDIPMRSPSGHTAAAAAAYGGLFVMLARLSGSHPVGRILMALCVAGVATLVGASRVVLHAHTLPEAVFGGLIGLTAPLLLSLPRPLFVGGVLAQRKWLLAVPFLACVLLFGFQANLEPTIFDLSHRLATWFGVCR